MSDKRNILFVDDNELILSLASKVLDSRVYNVDVANSAKQASELLANRKYNLVFCDIDLGDSSGYNLLAQRRNTGDDFTPFVFITGQNSMESEQKARMQGGADYVCKPFGTLQLQVTAARYARPFAHQIPKVPAQKVLYVANANETIDSRITNNIRGNAHSDFCSIFQVRGYLESTYYDIIVFSGKYSKEHQQVVTDFQELRPQTQMFVHTKNMSLTERDLLGKNVTPVEDSGTKSIDSLVAQVNELLCSREQLFGEELLSRIPTYVFGVGTRGSGKTLMFDTAVPAIEFSTRDFDSITSRKPRNAREFEKAKRRFATDSVFDQLCIDNPHNLQYEFLGNKYMVPFSQACEHMLLTRESVFSVLTPYEAACSLREKLVGAGQRHPVRFVPIFADPHLIIERLQSRSGFDPSEKKKIVEEYELYRYDLLFSVNPMFNTSFRLESASTPQDVRSLTTVPKTSSEAFMHDASHGLTANSCSVDPVFERTIKYLHASALVKKFLSYKQKFDVQTRIIK